MKNPLFSIPGLLLLFCGCTQSQSKSLTIYTSALPEQAQLLVDAYKADTGEWVEFVRLSTGEALTRIRTEKANPQSSLWLAGPAIEYAFGTEFDLFEKYKPNLSFEMNPKYHDPQWRWSGLYLGALAFATNKNFLEKNKLSPPTSWQDLLRPEYKGKVSFAFPYTSGTALTVVLAITKLMGEKEGFEYFKKLDAQVHHYTKSGSACINHVGLGEVGACIAFAHDILVRGVKKGYPVELSFPKEGTGYEIGGLALIKKGPQPDKAKKFMDWLFGPKGQKIFADWHQTPLHPNVPVEAPTVKVQDLALIDIEMDWAAENQKRLVSTWREITGK